jgi:hypothetical protein
MTASSLTVVAGQSVTYTATVTPAYAGSIAPTGTIQFDDNGTALGSCTNQPVNPGQGAANASCTVTYPTLGTHAIIAQYTGDGNFSGSTSGSTSVTSWSLQAQLRPPGKAASIRALLRHGRLAQRIRAATAGTLTIRWYAKAGHRHHILVATGRATYTGASTQTVTMTLTSAGRTALKEARRIRVAATATFVATGASPATVTLVFMLRRLYTRL